MTGKDLVWQIMVTILLVLYGELIFNSQNDIKSLTSQYLTTTKALYETNGDVLTAEANIHKLSEDIKKLAVEVKRLKDEDDYVNSIVTDSSNFKTITHQN